MIFVFGSNLSGIHGAGAARTAFQKHGAIYGEGIGHFGNSYAIPTKDRNIITLSIPAIRIYVDQFINYAKDHPHFIFQVTRIGCGLAGHNDNQIAPLFMDAPTNCHFDSAWSKILGNKYSYWGHVA